MHDLWFYAALAFAGCCIGLATSGLTGLGAFAVPILALVMSPIRAIGILLPIMVISDVIAVRAYSRHFDFQKLRVRSSNLFGRANNSKH